VQRSIQSSNRTSVQARGAQRRRGPASRLPAARWPTPLDAGRSAQNRRRPAPSRGARALELSAPLIPLTSRAMNRTRHLHVRSLGRPAVALVSVLALLASTCFPVLAQAETVYESESTNIPGGGGGNPSSHHKNTGSPESSPGAHQSTAPGGGADHSQNESSKSQNGASRESNPSSPGGGDEAQGKAGKSAVGNGKPLGSVQLGQPSSQVAESDGSSPLVPILIAVAVLAAISVGAVLVRQRRGSAGGFSLKRS
jgi:cobalamin biosynthesis Mg chelatase CobN